MIILTVIDTLIGEMGYHSGTPSDIVQSMRGQFCHALSIESVLRPLSGWLYSVYQR